MLLHRLLCVCLSVVPATSMAATELFFSEYIEGASNNKALEIANATGTTIDLSSYAVQMFFNGNTSPNLTINLTGTLDDGDVFVLAQSNATAQILSEADQLSSANWYNGDDAIALVNTGVPIDVIGQVGVDPGVQWGTGDTSTQNNTLRRIAPVAGGDSNPNNTFDPAEQWLGFAQDTFDNLGVFSNGVSIPTSTPVDAGDAGTGTSGLRINEIDVDNAGTDTLEFIELYDGGQGNTSLDGLVVVLFNGSDDASYDAIDLDGLATNTNGYFVLGSAGVANVDAVEFTSNGLQNGPDAVALIAGTADDFPNDTPLTTANLIDVLVYDTDDADDTALLDGLGSTEQVNEGGSGDRDNHSIQRCEDGFIQDNPTPGADNACVAVVPVVIGQCNTPATLISTIQGIGAVSALEGQAVEVEGIVVGDFQEANQLGGFYLQEEVADQDADANSSEGLFILAGTNIADVAVGDRVRVAGRVTEFFELTELNNVAAIEVCTSGLSVPPQLVQFPVESRDALEAVEGMLVTVPQTMMVTEHFNLGRFHEVVLASERLFQPTHLVAPGEAVQIIQAQNDLKRIILDDASSVQNPDPIVYPAPALSAFNTLRAGDTVSSVVGVLSYSFGEYRIQPTETPDFVSTNPRTSEPELALGGNVSIASFNVLNYFNGDGQGGGFPTPRGADTASEFDRQRNKIINALLAIDADIVALIELENDGYSDDSAIADLVNGLNANGQRYAFVDPGVPQIGTDAIAVGFIYKIDQVATVGNAAILDSSVDSRFIDTLNRPALAQTFRHLESRGGLTIAVNHLKSKGSDCDDVGDSNQNDGQGNCNITRTRAAEALVDWLANDPTQSGEDNIMIVGDLNAYAQEDPIRALVNGGYNDLLADIDGANAYSFVFGGQFGYLDYALANEVLTPQVVDVTEWHINADEPRVLDYNEEFKSPQQVINLYSPEPFRASDHDPVVIRVNLVGAEVVGDFNGNGRLDHRDFKRLVKAIYKKRHKGFNPAFDVNEDGRLNRQDVKAWLHLWRGE